MPHMDGRDTIGRGLLVHPRRRVRAPLLALLLAAGVIAWYALPAAAAPGEIDGDLPSTGGIALVHWGGGSVDAVDKAAAEGGCELESIWTFAGGAPIGFVIGAPPFANASFVEVFTPSALPEMPVILRCATPEPQADFADIELVEAFHGAEFERPVELVPYPGDRFLLAEQSGRVTMISAFGFPQHTVIDLSGQVRLGAAEGLLGMTLDPEFEENRHAWVYYVPADGDRRIRVSRLRISAAGLWDPASELVVLEVPHPASDHVGGALRFGSDGMLYVGIGDDGPSGDRVSHGQFRGTLLGAIVRIDVSNASTDEPYVVPDDNPFVSEQGRDEIWASGLRNPWRIAFDPDTGALWAADVGEDEVEEVNIIERGGNYGWSVMEGDQCYLADTCDDSGMIAPVATYTHDLGCSVIGGDVVRSGTVPELQGAYLYADFCSGRLWALDANNPGDPGEIARTGANPVSFTTAPTGEVYIIQHNGPVLRIEVPGVG